MKKIIFALLIIIALSGCGSDGTDTTLEPVVVDQDLIDEFNRHVDLFNQDVAESKEVLNGFDKNDEQSVTDYLDFAAKHINHLNEFYNFFTENKDKLKESGVDVFTWNNNIVDTAEELKSKTKELGYPIE